MTNSCLIISPIPDAMAQAVLRYFDSIEFEASAISVFETRDAPDSWKVAAYFPSPNTAEAAMRQLAVLGIDPKLAAIESVPQRDWVSLSLGELQPTRAGRFFIHGSHSRELRPESAVHIEIDAGLAFGTGHHGTTRGCLLAFDRLLKRYRPSRVLDLGCGSGILAIAAAKSTRCKILACDIDPIAVNLTWSNSRSNEVTPWIGTALSDGRQSRKLRGNGRFGLIFANILARPLVRLAGPISALLQMRAYLILSGITRDQESWLETAYRTHGLVVEHRLRLEGWSTLILRRGRNAKRPAAIAAGRRCR